MGYLVMYGFSQDFFVMREWLYSMYKWCDLDIFFVQILVDIEVLYGV